MVRHVTNTDEPWVAREGLENAFWQWLPFRSSSVNPTVTRCKPVVYFKPIAITVSVVVLIVASLAIRADLRRGQPEPYTTVLDDKQKVRQAELLRKLRHWEMEGAKLSDYQELLSLADQSGTYEHRHYHWFVMPDPGEGGVIHDELTIWSTDGTICSVDYVALER